ncbi:MAG: hypothetical protein WAW88_06180 [Nocardioides sp.]
MSSVNVPVPLVVAGASLCLLGGFLIGVVAGPESPSADEATVASYDSATRELCLEGEDVAEVAGADGDQLCGVWNRGAGSTPPKAGDRFRFLTLNTDQEPGGDQAGQVLIYGDVVD